MDGIRRRTLSIQLGCILSAATLTSCGTPPWATACLQPPRTDVGPVAPDRAVACAKLLSCPVPTRVTIPDHDKTTISECVLRSPSPVQPPPDLDEIVTDPFANSWVSVSCLSGAADCAAVAACITGPDPTVCDDTSQEFVTCVSNWRVNCSFGNLLAGDCTVEGTQCLLTSGGAACGEHVCSGSEPTTCDGTVLRSCVKGAVVPYDCARRDCAPCGASANGTAECSVPHPSCSPDRTYCDGNDIVHCTAGVESREHCNRFPVRQICGTRQIMTGPTSSEIVACVAAPGSACDPESYIDHCNGTVLIYCDGNEQTLDCAAVGFSDCTSNGATARCR